MVDFVRARCRSEEYSAEDILRVRGILQTNGVSQGLENGNALYPTFSFISHRCRQNGSRVLAEIILLKGILEYTQYELHGTG